MTIGEIVKLRELRDKYLKGLNGQDPYEGWDTPRNYADTEITDFLDWLEVYATPEGAVVPGEGTLG